MVKVARGVSLESNYFLKFVITWPLGNENFKVLPNYLDNRPFSYSAKEPGSSVIFIHFYTRDSIEWR